MKIEAELIQGYKLTLENRDTCRGQYYPEDDWDIIVYGKSIIDLVLRAKNQISSDFCYGGDYLEKCDIILYDDQYIEVPNTEENYKEYTGDQIYKMTRLSKEELNVMLREKKLERICE